jgi:5'/3'-nucleotidase SurE
MEAARVGIKAIALSTDFTTFDYALSELDNVYDFIMSKGLLDNARLLNVNIPTEPSRGILITRQGGTYYTDAYVYRGNDMYIQMGDPVILEDKDLTVDISAVQSGYISITPLTEQKTDWTAYEKLKTI